MVWSMAVISNLEYKGQKWTIYFDIGFILRNLSYSHLSSVWFKRALQLNDYRN